MTEPATDHRDQIHTATQRLIQTVDGITDNGWAEPSLLPGWTRGHVIAHLTLNAEALAGVLEGVTHGRTVPMYRSDVARDADIGALAGADVADARERFLAATTEFARAAEGVPADRLGMQVDRTPGGRTFAVGAIGGMRWREVEIHHADLGAGFTRADWPAEFAAHLIEAMTRRTPSAAGFSVHATDLDRTWTLGEGGPTVRGTAADLGWWLAGRGSGDGLSASEGALPEIASW